MLPWHLTFAIVMLPVVVFGVAFDQIRRVIKEQHKGVLIMPREDGDRNKEDEGCGDDETKRMVERSFVDSRYVCLAFK